MRQLLRVTVKYLITPDMLPHIYQLLLCAADLYLIVYKIDYSISNV